MPTKKTSKKASYLGLVGLPQTLHLSLAATKKFYKDYGALIEATSQLQDKQAGKEGLTSNRATSVSSAEVAVVEKEIQGTEPTEGMETSAQATVTESSVKDVAVPLKDTATSKTPAVKTPRIPREPVFDKKSVSAGSQASEDRQSLRGAGKGYKRVEEATASAKAKNLKRMKLAEKNGWALN